MKISMVENLFRKFAQCVATAKKYASYVINHVPTYTSMHIYFYLIFYDAFSTQWINNIKFCENDKSKHIQCLDSYRDKARGCDFDAMKGKKTTEIVR